MTDLEQAFMRINDLATTVLEDTSHEESTRRSASRIRDEAIQALLTMRTEPTPDTTGE